VPIPEDAGAPTIEDYLAEEREREYERGTLYWVLVPDIFSGDGYDFRLRVFVGWEDRDGERWPCFVREREWQEIRLQEATGELESRLREAEAKLAEHAAAEQTSDKSEFYSVKRAAQLLDLSERTIYKLIRSGDLHAFQVGGQYRIPSDALDELQQRRSAPPVEDDAPTNKPAPPLFNPNFRRDTQAGGSASGTGTDG